MLKMVFWDVQHGNATYIETPNKSHIVQDLGTGSLHPDLPYFSPLLHICDKYGVSQLDWVIITHPHRDHIDDIFNFDELSPRILTRPKHLGEEDIRQGNQPGDDDHIEKYLEISDRYSSPVGDSENPRLSPNNGGVEIKTFIPRSCGRSNLNNHSIVTVLSYATSKIVLSGDNEPPSWTELLERDSFQEAIVGADILLAPHHGRESAYCSGLFEHFKPKLTIISDGPSDSSAVNKYSSISSGLTVHKRSGGEERRKCVTTRSDGVVVVKFGYIMVNKPFIGVWID